jgi:hypothetical protein
VGERKREGEREERGERREERGERRGERREERGERREERGERREERGERRERRGGGDEEGGKREATILTGVFPTGGQILVRDCVVVIQHITREKNNFLLVHKGP